MRKLFAIAAFLVLGSPAARGDGAGEPFPEPAGQATLHLGSSDVRLWPWTGTDFSGRPSDPVNLVFLQDADPRLIRQALMSLSGDRSTMGLPPVAPFNCTWRDAIGAPQTSWAEGEGWTGSAVGLECGDYDPLRVHVRLFRHGDVTLGAAHFEVLIPGTTTHEVLSWEFAQAFVAGDLARSGFLAAAPEATAPVTTTPSWRVIRWQVFNGVPAALRGLLGLPLANQSSDVPVPNDGRATVLRVYQTLALEKTDIRRDYVQQFNQVVPRPFCATGPADYLYVQGPLHFRFRVLTDASGGYHARFSAMGVLQATPVNPLTGLPTGPTVPAVISERHSLFLSDRRSEASLDREQSIQASPAQTLLERLDAGHSDRYRRSVDCGPTP